jgi:hypothetical protein
VMRHVQHLSLESLVKMDHFQKEPPLNLKGTTGRDGLIKTISGHDETGAATPRPSRRRLKFKTTIAI